MTRRTRGGESNLIANPQVGRLLSQMSTIYARGLLCSDFSICALQYLQESGPPCVSSGFTGTLLESSGTRASQRTRVTTTAAFGAQGAAVSLVAADSLLSDVGRAATAKSAEGGLTHDPDMPLSSLAKKAQSMEFTLNRPAKTPVMVRLRRGSSYKFRAIEDDDQGDAPEEDPEHGDAVYPDEDAVYLDEDPVRLYEDLVPRWLSPLAQLLL